MSLVSVIIPVYNVEQYLGECLESVTSQTHDDIEIILINDGSTDSSGKECELWAARDTRIRYVDKKNEGLGATRNLGVSMARGECVAFVDSDDWIDKTYIGKLYTKLSETRADISFCDRYTYDSTDGSLTLVRNKTHGEVVETRSEKSVIYNVFHNAWAKLFSKRFLLENDLHHPTGYYEDGIIPLWIAISKRMAYVSEPLYYYRLFRTGAITNTVDNLASMRNHFTVVGEEFKKRGLFTDFYNELGKFYEFRILSHLGYAKQVFDVSRNKTETEERKLFQNIRDDFMGLYAEMFGKADATAFLEAESNVCIAFGSYNLRRAAQRYCGGSYSDSSLCYCFSSVISAMSPYSAELNAFPVRHSVAFREQQVRADFTKSFAQKNRRDIEGIDCVILDFLEERFPIGSFGETYLTISDAFFDIFVPDGPVVSVLSRGMDETEAIWREKCLLLIQLLKTVYAGKPVVLVGMKLAEYHGFAGKEQLFDGIDRIREINALLDSCYEYFQKHCPWCRFVSVEDEAYYFTYSRFSHGCYPWHLNEEAYLEMGKKIRHAVNRGDG